MIVRALPIIIITVYLLGAACPANADAVTETAPAVADKWALVIGISRFKDPSVKLKYASKDAKDFYDYLVSQAHFAPDHVKLL
ncbi:MAG: caspase family protein, partial [Candidatus Melainabacteria bacterium]|nr:caspase family protein [Candidatus Melainabacteria bacterium]